MNVAAELQDLLYRRAQYPRAIARPGAQSGQIRMALLPFTQWPIRCNTGSNASYVSSATIA